MNLIAVLSFYYKLQYDTITIIGHSLYSNKIVWFMNKKNFESNYQMWVKGATNNGITDSFIFYTN